MKVFKDYLSKLEESSHYHALHGTDSWRSQMDNSQNKLMNMYKKQCEQNKRYRELLESVRYTDDVAKEIYKENTNLKMIGPDDLLQHILRKVNEALESESE